MTRTLPSGWAADVRRVHRSTTYCWGLVITLSQSAAANVAVALTDYHEDVTRASITFRAYPMQIEPQTETGEGSLPSLSVTLANHGWWLMPYLESPGDERGLMNRPATIYLFKTDDTTNVDFWLWRVSEVSATAEALTLSLRPPEYFDRRVPQTRFDSGLCRFKFGDPVSGCPYVVNVNAAYTTCGKTYADCEARGADQVFRNIPRTLPSRFGGFPGIAER